MTGKPYEPRKGGRYERDPKSGKREKVSEKPNGQSASKDAATPKSEKG